MQARRLRGKGSSEKHPLSAASNIFEEVCELKWLDTVGAPFGWALSDLAQARGWLRGRSIAGSPARSRGPAARSARGPRHLVGARVG